MHLQIIKPKSVLQLLGYFTLKFTPMKLSFLFLLLTLSSLTHAQVVLSGTSYTQNFNSLVNGMPLGWTIRTSASSTALGTDVSSTLIATPSAEAVGALGTYWKNITAGFKNFASYSPTLEGKTADQANATNRALGIRQSSRLGDPGAAFVLQISNTQGFRNFQLDFWLQSLDNSNGERQTTWTVDFALGNTPSTFTSLATGFMTGNNTYSNTHISLNLPTSIDNQGQTLWLRIVTLSASTNPSNAANPTRTSSAIDDFTLSYQTMPTPISLVYFKGEETNTQTARLYWKTATEYQNDYFELARSQDLQAYEIVATIKGQENTTTEQWYVFEDTFPLQGVTYYRLCQIDLDQQRVCYRPVAVAITPTKVLQVFPNPVQRSQKITLVAEDVAQIRLHDMAGNAIAIEFTPYLSNYWEAIIPDNLTVGLYVLQIWQKNDTKLEVKIRIE